MREKQKQALQTELGDKVLAKIIIIQRWTRAKLLRCRFLHFRRSAIMIQVCSIRSPDTRTSIVHTHVVCIVTIYLNICTLSMHCASSFDTCVYLTLITVCCEVLACQEKSGLSSKASLFCRIDSVSLENLHGQEEAYPSKAGSHYSPGTLQRTAGSKEICYLAGEVQGREGEKEKRGGVTEKEEGEGKARS